jgi:ankyrin repeat protein
VDDIFQRSSLRSPVSGSRPSSQLGTSRPTTQQQPQAAPVDPKIAFQETLKLHDRSILGWAIMAKNTALVMYLLDMMAVDPASLVDTQGNNALHYVGKYGSAEMAARILQNYPVAKVFASMVRPKSTGANSTFAIGDIKVQSVTAASIQDMSKQFQALISASGPTSSTSPQLPLAGQPQLLRLEGTNNAGLTAAAEAAISGNLPVLRELVAHKASARTGLRKGKYWAFLLALARRQESVEINTQTGMIGDDDTKYHSVAPDPHYTTWYQEE